MTTDHLSEYKSDLLLSGLADATAARYYKWVTEFVKGQDEAISPDNIEDLIDRWLAGPNGETSAQFKRSALNGYARTVYGVDPASRQSPPDYEPIINIMKAVRDLAPRWMDKAICKGQDTRKVFFAEQTVTKAKAICNSGCPVKSECLSFAMENQEWGVWGGTSRTDRARMRKLMTSDSGSSVG